MNARADRFPLVDSLRAIAAISVLLTHAMFFAGAYNGHTAIGPYAQRLDVGVTIFFLISGFLLYRPFVKARLTGSHPPATGPYAWRRFLRIVPAYWVALTVTVLWLGTDGVFTASGVPTFYLLGQTYRESTIGGGLTQAWTLTVEIAFYAFLPLYAAFMRRMRGGIRSEWIALAVLVVIAEVWKIAILANGNAHQVRITPMLIAFPAFLDHFALGMALAVLTVRTEMRGVQPRWVMQLDRAPMVSWIVAAVAFWAVSTQIGITQHFFGAQTAWQYFWREALYAVVALGVMLPAVVGDESRGLNRWILRRRTLAWLGLISYGIYLWHDTVLHQLALWDLSTHVTFIHPYVRWAVFGLGATVVIAAASYYVVERPALSLKRLVGKRDPAPPGEALTEPAPAGPAG